MGKKTYVTIKEEIEEKIRTGEYKAGDRLKSEFEMAKKFGVSRETFRSAVRLLEQENKLLVKHGVGTFVVNLLPEIPSSLEKLSSIGALIQAAGLEEGERQESRSTSCPGRWSVTLLRKRRFPVPSSPFWSRPAGYASWVRTASWSCHCTPTGTARSC